MVLLAFLVAVLVAPPSAYAWSAVKYADAAYAGPFTEFYTIAYATRIWNKVWRPQFYSFCLAYDSYPYVCDAYANPWVDERDALNAGAFCLNNSGLPISPVTCVTTRP